MALPATGVIEIRATATANNVNGGGFNSARSGTDYTLQDAAQLTGTDGSAAGGTTFTSVSGGFTDAMKGNYIHLTASTGLTVGWYEIVSVTDTNNVELDRTPGTGTLTTYYVGGAMSLNSTLDDDLFEIAISGNTYWIKNGAYSLGESVSSSIAGGASSIRIFGYNSTRGDNPTGSTRPTIACGANSWTTPGEWRLNYVIFTGTAVSVYTSATQTENAFVKVTNTSTTADRDAFVNASGSKHPIFYMVEGISYRGDAYASNNNTGVSYGWFHDSNRGIRLIGGAASPVTYITDNIVSSCVTAALDTTPDAPYFFDRNTLYGAGNKQGTGISLVGNDVMSVFRNNIIYGFVTGATLSAADGKHIFDYNDWYNNTTDVTNITKGDNDLALDPQFVSVGQVTGTTGAFTAANDRLVDTSKNFTTAGVVAGRDYLHIKSGTGVTAGIYGVASVATTTNPNDTLVLDIAPGTNTTADKVYQLTIGQNFAIGTNLKAAGNPGAFPGGYTTSYLDSGAPQRQEAGSGTGNIFNIME